MTETLATLSKPDRLIGAILEISYLVGSVMRLDDILERIVRITSNLMAVPVCSVYMLQPDRTLLLSSNIGLDPHLRGYVRFKLGEGIVGTVGRDGRLIALADATQDPRYRPFPAAVDRKLKAYLCAPLRIQEEIIGVMTARRTDVHAFSPEECMLFETVSKQIAIVIEKARMYEEKIQAERLAGVAISLSEVAHYIKNVLFTTQVSEALVEKGLNEPVDLDRVRKGWAVLQQAHLKIRKLVENMLNYCRKSSLKLYPVDLNAMIRQIAETVCGQQGPSGVELVTELDPSLTLAMLEPDSMYDALLNLVTNGIDAIPSDRRGRLVIRTERLAGQNNFKVDVSDNGAGMAVEIQDKIFNLFFSTKGEKGTGIGLAATRKTVEDHKGAIAFTSRPGEGTTFTLHLPICSSPDNWT